MSGMIDKDLLAKGLEALGLAHDAHTLDAFTGYAELLLKWNKVYNLTAIRRPEEMLTHHLLDSAALVPNIDTECDRILDVGCGGGLPSVPIAILRSDLQVTGIDAVGKKVAFVNQAAIELGLKNLRAVHNRVEKLDGQWRLITSRAFASLPDFVSLTRSLLAPGGRWLAMKGVLPEEEIRALPAGVRVDRVVPMIVPGLNEKRNLIVLVDETQ